MDSISVDRTAPASSASDPFDFSDFGGRASGGPGHPELQSRPGVPSGGFDPFEGQAPTVTTSAVAETFADPANPEPSSAFAVAGPPLRLFSAAFAVAALGVVSALLSYIATQGNSSVMLAFVGWLLAGPAAIGVLAWCSRLDTRRRLSAVYSAPAWLRPAYWAVLATCAAGIGMGAWQLALWAGRF